MARPPSCLEQEFPLATPSLSTSGSVTASPAFTGICFSIFILCKGGHPLLQSRSCSVKYLQSSTTRLSVFVLLFSVPVKPINVSGDQTVLEGSHTTLFCEATGRPTPNITLTRVLEDGSDSEVLPQGSTWNFPNINRTTSGTYRCTAENEYEKVSQVFKVNVTCKYFTSPINKMKLIFHAYVLLLIMNFVITFST